MKVIFLRVLNDENVGNWVGYLVVGFRKYLKLVRWSLIVLTELSNSFISIKNVPNFNFFFTKGESICILRMSYTTYKYRMIRNISAQRIDFNPPPKHI